MGTHRENRFHCLGIDEGEKIVLGGSELIMEILNFCHLIIYYVRMCIFQMYLGLLIIKFHSSKMGNFYLVFEIEH